MDIRKLQRAIVDGLEDVKAQDIAVFNTEHLSALFERVIIASGTSNRQTKALAASVRDAVREHGFPVMRTEGEDNGEWIIVDCGAAVAHIMQPAIRQYYHLEEIWGGKPVKMKFGEVVTKLVKAESPGRGAAPQAAAKKAAPKADARNAAPSKPRAAAKAAPKKAAPRKASAQAVAKKAPASKSPAAQARPPRSAPKPAPRAASKVAPKAAPKAAGKAAAPARGARKSAAPSAPRRPAAPAKKGARRA
jgi:ribosome-associated protein